MRLTLPRMPLTTRTLTNTGAPLYGPGGDLLVGVTVRFTLVTSAGRPTDAWDATTNERIAGSIEVETDEDGEFSLELWPNDRGNRPTMYLCEVLSPGFQAFRAPVASGLTDLDWVEFMAQGQALSDQELSGVALHIADTSAAHAASAISLAAIAGMAATTVQAGIAELKTGLSASVLATTLTGLSLASAAPITAASTVLEAFGQLQGQVTALDAATVKLAGSYADPSWITSLAGSKLTGSIATATLPVANLTGTTLPASVVNSSLTSVGTLTSLAVSGNTSVGGNLSVTGDLHITGTTVTFDTENITSEDPLVKVARSNTGDVLDIGVYGQYQPAATPLYTGFFRDASDNKLKFFTGLQEEPTTTVNIAGTGYTLATLVANLEGNVTGNLTGNVTGNVAGNVTGALTGNATTATALQTARAINGVNFDGTAAITVAAAAGTLTGGTLAANVLASSLTSLGTLTTLTVSGAVTAAGIMSYTAGSGIVWRLRGSDVSATTRNFNFGVSSFPGVNLPGDSRQNTVVSFGWNVAANGTREDVTEAACRIAFEEHYLQGGTGDAAFELHVGSVFDSAGTEHRPFSFYLPKSAASTASVLTLATDKMTFNKWDGTQRFQYNMNSGSGNAAYESGFQNLWLGNNYAFTQQRNAANSAYLPLPYLNAEDRLQANASGFQCVGATPTAGTYANVFFVLQATTLPAGGTMLYFQGPSVTGSAYGNQTVGACTTDFIHAHYNNTNNANANAVIELRTIGPAAGDPLIRYNVNGGTQWQVGVDNSDSDKFKWSTSALGSADKMALDTSGNLTVTSIFVGTTAQIGSGGDGVLLLRNAASTDFARIQFGGTSSSFPALRKGGGSQIDVVLADASAWAKLKAGELEATTTLTVGTTGTFGGTVTVVAGTTNGVSLGAIAGNVNLYGVTDVSGSYTPSGAGTEVMSYRAYATLALGASNTITNWYGFNSTLASKTGAAVLTNAYAFYANSPTAATNNYAFYSSGTAASVLGGALSVAGDFAVATNKFTVAAATGNTLIAGTLSVGTHSAIAAETVTGYITIKDSGGTDRKLAVVS